MAKKLLAISAGYSTVIIFFTIVLPLSYWVGHCLDRLMRRLKKLLHDLMILIQKGIQLFDQLLRIGLSLRQFGFDAIDFGVQIFCNLFHVNEVTVLVLFEIMN